MLSDYRLYVIGFSYEREERLKYVTFVNINDDEPMLT